MDVSPELVDDVFKNLKAARKTTVKNIGKPDKGMCSAKEVRSNCDDKDLEAAAEASSTTQLNKQI